MKHNKVFFITILGLLLITFISGCTNVPMTPSIEKELDDASGISIIEIAGPSLSASPNIITPGGKVTVNFTGAPGYYRDWIGLFKIGSSNYTRISYQYLRGQKNGSIVFSVPTTLGKYEFRLFRNGSYYKFATSNQVTVQKASPTPTPTPTPLAGSSPTSTPTPTPTPTPNLSINYQLISQYSYGKNNVVRWKDGVIKVKDSTNYPGINVQDVLNQWNSIIGGTTTFQLSTDSTSPITIFYDAASITSQGNGVWGYATVWWSNYQLIKAEIRVLPEGNWYGYPIKPKYELYLHEFGHVAGFAGHTNDGSVMDAIANGSSTISSTTRTVINGLYSLPIGYALTKSPYNIVPKDGMMVIPLMNR
ncbi:hypothetical protein [Atribacter sp.]|uniref:hypothetical protein n=1 Tax=Atribacter sp. TaxID=2847780 RepID=UPI00345EF663